MLEWLILTVLWVIVGDLCIERLNETYDDSEDWFDMPMWARAGITVIAPLIYSGVRCKEAFKK